MLPEANLVAVWVGILLGFVAGSIQGLFFHKPGWLGGYGSWPRRMTRLGHISFFGLAFINLAYVLTVWVRDIPAPSPWAGWLFIAGAVLMPLVCYLSAWRKSIHHLFPLPVLCLTAGAILFLSTEVLP